jgi:hypothetical protein
MSNFVSNMFPLLDKDKRAASNQERREKEMKRQAAVRAKGQRVIDHTNQCIAADKKREVEVRYSRSIAGSQRTSTDSGVTLLSRRS